MPVKNIFKSKTMGFALLVMLIQFLDSNSHWFQSLVPDNYGEVAGYAIGLIIAGLRLATVKPVVLPNKVPKFSKSPKFDNEGLKDF